MVPLVGKSTLAIRIGFNRCATGRCSWPCPLAKTMLRGTHAPGYCFRKLTGAPHRTLRSHRAAQSRRGQEPDRSFGVLSPNNSGTAAGRKLRDEKPERSQPQDRPRAEFKYRERPRRLGVGDEPMTGAQASYLKMLSEECDEPNAFTPGLSKGAAWKRL